MSGSTTIFTRETEPAGQVILIQTRWHEDDLAGRLRREMTEDPEGPQWEIIELPALPNRRENL